MKVQINKVIVKSNRQRQTYTQQGMDSLKESMTKFGQLHPLVVVRLPDDNEFNLESGGCDCGQPNTNESNPHSSKCNGTYYQLVSGERRLTAARELAWNFVEIKEKVHLSDLELEEVELDENLQREDLSWQELVKAKQRVWVIRAQLYGDTVKEAAEHIGISHGSLWEDATLAQAIEEVPELAKSKNKTQAMNKLRLLKRRIGLTELASRDSLVVEGNVDYSSRVLLGNCIELIKGIKDESISLVLTDPPYGINLDIMETKKGNLHPTIYSDDHQEIMEVVRLAATEAYRVLKPDSHAYFWFDIKAHATVLSFLQEIGFKVDPVPLIWVKNTPGQTNHPDSRWASGYEACFFCLKGKRPLLKQGATNVLRYDTVPPAQKIHPVEKPYLLLQQLIEASTVADEIVLDMFGGSGSTAEAAIRSGRDFILMERDPAFHAGIIERLSRIKQSSVDPEMLDNGSEDEDDEENLLANLQSKGRNK